MIASVLAILLAIDPTHSSARFSVEHVFVQHVEGSVPILRGTVDVPAGSLIPRRVSAQLDAAQLRTDDPDRDDALRSAEWFDTARFPTWSFVSTAIVPDARGIRIDGMLTVHGVTQPETLMAVASGTPAAPHYHATCRIDRHAFGMSVTRLDPVIGNPVDVVLDITAR